MKRALIVGKIVNTHSLRGEVKVYPYTNDLERFGDLEYVYLDEAFQKKLIIEGVRTIKNMILLKFEGLDHINDVEKLKDQTLYIDREVQGAQLDDDEYYVVDLIGLKVLDAVYGDVGVVVDVLQNSAQDVYQIKTIKGEMAYVPAVKAFIGDVDLEKGILHTTLIDGLLP